MNPLTPGAGPGPLVDTHAHLDDRRLRADLPGHPRSCRQGRRVPDHRHRHHGRLERRVRSSSPANTAGIFAAVGIHPNEAAEVGQQDWPLILDMIGRPGVVAIGETGLDRYWDRTPFAEQQAVVRSTPGPRPRPRPADRHSLPRLPERHHRTVAATRSSRSAGSCTRSPGRGMTQRPTWLWAYISRSRE